VERHASLLKRLVSQEAPEPVRAAAVRAFAQIKGLEVAKLLLATWKTLPPSARREAADGMLTEKVRTKVFFSAIQDGLVQPWTLNFQHKRRLMENPDPVIRDAARSILRFPEAARAEVLKRYQAVLSAKSDADRGEKVFRDVCAKCHKLNGIGAEVGPDLSTVRSRGKGALLSDILLPNKSIATGYESGLRQSPTNITNDEERI